MSMDYLLQKLALLTSRGLKLELISSTSSFYKNPDSIYGKNVLYWTLNWTLNDNSWTLNWTTVWPLLTELNAELNDSSVTERWIERERLKLLNDSYSAKVFSFAKV